MRGKIIRNNISRNKLVSLAAALFIAAAAALISLAAILAVNLSGAIDRLMQKAATPHFMQMHTGTIDMAELEHFANTNGSVSQFQVLEFLNLDNSQIVLGENSLAGSVQDNGVSVQSGKFDFLLDFNDEPVRPGEGEIFVPVCYFRDGTVKEGDTAVINGIPFTVAGFVRDSQMNSALASSKRFIVSSTDYGLLERFGKAEYLIEFRLNDRSGLGAFETAYSEAKLPAGGPALTWPLFRLMSAASDGIMIAVIVLVGILVILIALLCIRFTLLSKIEEDYREIGVMRAVGMRISDIRGIYLAIYAAIAAAGCIAGVLLSTLFRKPLLESIRLNLGSGGNGVLASLFGMAGAAAVFLLILLYVNHGLRSFRNISAVQALRFGAVQDIAGAPGAMKLSENRVFSANLFLAAKDVLTRKRLYSTMLFIVVLASFIMIVPRNLYHTISDKNFVTYMGVGNCDLRLDIWLTGGINDKTAEIQTAVGADPEISKYALFTTRVFSAVMEDGTMETVKVELGDHSVFPLQYAEGKLPEKEDEIALSALNAQELGKKAGDTIILTGDGGETEMRLTVCGIYSDITNGGKTAKAVFKAESAETAWAVICADLKPAVGLTGKIAEYASGFPDAKVSAVGEYMNQTFGQTLSAVKKAWRAAVIVSVAVTLLVTLLFMKLLTAKDRYSIAIMRAVGYTGSDIGRQYAWRAVFVLAAGIITGTVLAGTLGEKLAGMAIASFGAVSFRFAADHLFTFLISPLLMLATALAATILGTFRVGDVRVYEAIKE